MFSSSFSYHNKQFYSFSTSQYNVYSLCKFANYKSAKL